MSLLDASKPPKVVCFGLVLGCTCGVAAFAGRRVLEMRVAPRGKYLRAGHSHGRWDKKVTKIGWASNGY